MQLVAVIDYGMGNLRSVAKALEHAGEGAFEVDVTDSAQRIERAERVVFPGQGAARDCMAEIHHHHLEPAIRASIEGKPFLGICMGLQVLMDRSEEHGNTPCLGVIAGDVRRLPDAGAAGGSTPRLSVPHMGWNRVRFTREHPLWRGIESDTRFYFMNSYYVAPDDTAVVAGRTEYGIEFASAVARANLFAVQFHPEKSQRAGLTLLGNFLRWDGAQ